MDKKELRVVFMGTPEIASFVLEALVNDGYQVVGVIAQPDKPIGRKKELLPVPTKVVAERYGIPVFQPVKVRQDFGFLKEINPDVVITLAYGQIVPQGLLDIPRFGCLNLHGSLLPKYRGAAPMQYALINGETETGVCLMEMIDRMDAGRIFAVNKVKITDDETLSSLTEKMKICARDILLDKLPKYIDGFLTGEEQDESLVTFAPSIKKDQEHLDLKLPCHTIVNWIRALNSVPGAYLVLDGTNIKIWEAKVLNNLVTHDLGTIITATKSGFVFQGIDGQISIITLQKEGKAIVNYKDFVNGNKDLTGKIFE